MTTAAGLPVDRFLQTLEIVAREGKHLSYSWNRLFQSPIDEKWVRNLENAPDVAEQLEAFVSRFGRMQDTIADKLLPRWLQALAEVPGSQIETLHRAERLGVLGNSEDWLAARNLRNRLVNEYSTEPEKFAQDLSLAKEYSQMLLDTFNRVCDFALTRMNLVGSKLPCTLMLKSF